MARLTPAQAGSANRVAFLDMLAWSEIGPALLAISDDGYNVLVGSTPAHPLLFHSYDRHPDVLNHQLNSTAAGRYQLIHATWLECQQALRLPDFSPQSQEWAALHLIRERGAMPAIDAGRLSVAIDLCAAIWASLPGNSYGQPEHPLADLQAAYGRAGGVVA
ncbi:glycoside hydrolase family 104 protein [Acidocella sp.]|uniref:glycoside hydrolase family 24 protein n=1 Tax=Acidocella sp. TaxID=50710 RepID=UPI00260DAD7D|nr:glycoside hydrolase family 104 protein [Acidocella sp.]